MGMSLGGTGRLKADVNMTPMIDVLLVLIIIFLPGRTTILSSQSAAISLCA